MYQHVNSYIPFVTSVSVLFNRNGCSQNERCTLILVMDQYFKKNSINHPFIFCCRTKIKRRFLLLIVPNYDLGIQVITFQSMLYRQLLWPSCGRLEFWANTRIHVKYSTWTPAQKPRTSISSVHIIALSSHTTSLTICLKTEKPNAENLFRQS